MKYFLLEECIFILSKAATLDRGSSPKIIPGMQMGVGGSNTPSTPSYNYSGFYIFNYYICPHIQHCCCMTNLTSQRQTLKINQERGIEREISPFKLSGVCFYLEVLGWVFSSSTGLIQINKCLGIHSHLWISLDERGLRQWFISKESVSCLSLALGSRASFPGTLGMNFVPLHLFLYFRYINPVSFT